MCVCVCVLLGVLLAGVMGCGFVTLDCDWRGSLGCVGFVCVCVLLGVLLAGMMACKFVTSDCDRHGSLGCGGFVCVCVFCLVFCLPA